MFLQTLLLHGLRLRLRVTHHDPPVDFCAHLRSARKLLIALPIRGEEIHSLQRHLRKLRGLFPDSELYFLYQDSKQLPRSIPPTHAIGVSRSQLRYRAYPSRLLREDIRSRNFDVCIDFNQKFDFVSTVLCAATGADVRICLEEPRREPFFNLQIKVSHGSSGAKSYNRMIRFIESCKTESDS